MCEDVVGGGYEVRLRTSWPKFHDEMLQLRAGSLGCCMFCEEFEDAEAGYQLVSFPVSTPQKLDTH